MSQQEANQSELENQEPTTEAQTQPAEATTDTLEVRVRELEQQLEESRNRQLYLLSDFENFKRHAARERMDMMQTAGRDILAALLPVLDDFDRAARTAPLGEGVALVHHKLQHILEQKGLTSMKVNVGDTFNADYHEAVVEIDVPDPEQKGAVVDIIEQGYTLGERILRHAKVVVGK